jgi:excinuclease ABC subunit C
VLVRKIDSVEYLATETETEAVLTEARLIRELKPRYNVRQKDDKSFNQILITRYDDFPKIWIVRQTDRTKGDRYGPCSNALELRQALKSLQRVFRFATCKLTIMENDPKLKFFRPCLLYSIGRCSAPCAGHITRSEYLENIQSFKRFLHGEKEGLLKDLSDKMDRAAQMFDYERAAELRDQVKSIRNLPTVDSQGSSEVDITPLDPEECLKDLAKILEIDFVPRTLEACDIANVQGREAVGSVVSFFNGIPNKEGYRRFKIKLTATPNDLAMIKEVVFRRFRHLEESSQKPPDVFLVDGGKGQLQAAAEAVAPFSRKPTRLVALAKKNEELFMYGRKKKVDCDQASLGMRILMHARDEAHRFAQHYHHILRSKKVLGKS